MLGWGAGEDGLLDPAPQEVLDLNSSAVNVVASRKTPCSQDTVVTLDSWTRCEGQKLGSGQPVPLHLLLMSLKKEKGPEKGKRWLLQAPPNLLFHLWAGSTGLDQMNDTIATLQPQV